MNCYNCNHRIERSIIPDYFQQYKVFHYCESCTKVSVCYEGHTKCHIDNCECQEPVKTPNCYYCNKQIKKFEGVVWEKKQTDKQMQKELMGICSECLSKSIYKRVEDIKERIESLERKERKRLKREVKSK